MGGIMIRADNFRIVAAGGLPDVIDQVRRWHEGVRVMGTWADVVPLRSAEDTAWDRLIRTARDAPHRNGKLCKCHNCRPRRKYK